MGRKKSDSNGFVVKYTTRDVIDKIDSLHSKFDARFDGVVCKDELKSVVDELKKSIVQLRNEGDKHNGLLQKLIFGAYAFTGVVLGFLVSHLLGGV